MGRPAGPAGRRPVQLELFGNGHPALPRDTGERPRPTVVPHPDAARLALMRALNRLTGGRVAALTLTENRRTILSVRPGRPGDQLALRIHRCFLDAPPVVLAAVAAFVESRKGTDRSREALATIRQHFSHHSEGRRPRRARTSLRTEGVAFDLREMVDDLNQRYFDGRLKVEITWGKSSVGEAHRCRRGRRTSSLQLGSYSYEDKLIRLHRVLDQPGVPRYVLEAVVYHELLHADLPPVERNGRRYFHTPEFRRRERLYRNLDRADRWILEHLPELLQARQNARRR